MKESRLEFLKDWVKDALSHEDIKFNITVNDDTDNERTAFEVLLTNETNKYTCTVIMQVTTEDGWNSVEILWGEDFESCDHENFLRYVILDVFLTHPEA
mgnify:CR=1